ncbi:MFS transporter [Lentzea sp. JNUCC 0626]|uniref:MFS transporter n=1 Tax=Lentzea sp. JNUCC 0626 TaxID=3367513 RepID=UPI00374A49B0
MITQTASDQRVSVAWLALLATPAALSANAATTAIPVLAADLGVPIGAATWIATAFGWAALVGTPVTAALMRARGARFAAVLNAALIVLGTVLVLVAPGLPLLFVGRAVQAAGGGGLVVLGYGLAGTARRTGVLAASFGLVGACGPLAGAALSEFSWRAALSLSLLGLLAVPAVLRRAPARQGSGAGDGTGLVLVLALLSAVVLVPRFPLVGLAVVALAALVAWHVRRRPEGFVPLEVVRTRAFRSSALVVCALSTSYFVLLYTVPRLLERQWAADRIGVTTLVAMAAGSAAAMVLSRYSTWFVPVIAGAVAAVLTWATPWPAAWVAALAFAVFASATGMGWYANRATTAVPGPDRVVTSGLITLSYQLGGAAGPALAALTIG